MKESIAKGGLAYDRSFQLIPKSKSVEIIWDYRTYETTSLFQLALISPSSSPTYSVIATWTVGSPAVFVGVIVVVTGARTVILIILSMIRS